MIIKQEMFWDYENIIETYQITGHKLQMVQLFSINWKNIEKPIRNGEQKTDNRTKLGTKTKEIKKRIHKSKVGSSAEKESTLTKRIEGIIKFEINKT
ncbi:1053_t:CDS:2 [Entrophospora sp. SA101]|nr:1053_t:CDS:2 [Entrophospora sp. SA101]